MNVTDSHFEVHVRDLAAARHFYVEQLGLPVLQDTPAMKLLAVRAGTSRLSIFADRADAGGAGPCQIILAVPDIEQAVEQLRAAGLEVAAPVTAGTFLSFVTLSDPEGNSVAVAEYLRDPIVSV